MLNELFGDRYRVQRKLGEGGMAIVYLALDEKLGRNVAIKVLREKFENHAEIRSRFQHEARAISSFDHPNILKIYDYSGQNSQRMWIVTELIHGRNLGQIVETAPGGWLHPVIAACIVREVCKALSLAHSTNIVHRDVKPDNVMITQQGVVKLMDFGIAKIQQNNSMTQTGMFMGSPSYMSPEQVRGRDIDHRSDIYSLGVLFYELVTGRLPFSGQSTADVAIKILEGQFQHPRFLKDHLPVEINDLIVSTMMLDPGQRPRSADTVAGVIDQFLERNGFEASHSELERCFRDPKSYSERLARLIQQTVVVAMPTHVLRSDRMQDAAKLPHSADALVRSVRDHNEHAIDHPKPYIPETVAIINPAVVAREKDKVYPPLQRRDHAIPKSATPHVTRHVAMPTQLITAHLPERRWKQRPEQVTVHPVAPASSDGSATAKNLQSTPRPSPNSDKNAGSSSKARPPRSLPRVPQRAKPQVRYVIHRQAYIQRSSSTMSTLFGLLLVVAAAVLSYNIAAELGLFGLGHTDTAQQKNPRKRPVVSKMDTPKTPIANKQNTPSDQASLPTPKEDSEKPTLIAKDKTVPTIQRQNKSQQKSKDHARDKAEEKDREKKLSGGTATVEKSPAATPVLAGVKPTSSGEEKNNAVTEAPQTKSEERTNTNQKPQSESTTGTAKIQISASPAAEIYINSRRMGTTNDAGISSAWLDVPAGNLRLELRREGYASRSEAVNLAAGDRKKLGPYTLSRGEEKAASPIRYKLTLMSSLSPSNAVITNVETKASRTLILQGGSQTLMLEKGVYDVTIEHKGETKRRRIDFNGTTSQLTFSAEFREAQN